MDIAQSTKESKPQLTPYQEGIAKALKASGEAHAAEAMSQTNDPMGMANHIQQQAGLVDTDTLKQLMALAGTQTKVKSDGSLFGDKVGILPALMKTLSGNPTSPMADKTTPIGLDNAIQLAGFQQTSNKNAMDAQKFPGEMQLQKGQIAEQPLNLQKLIGDILTQAQSYDQNSKMNPLVQQKAEQDLTQGTTQSKLDYAKKEQDIKDNAGNLSGAQDAAETANALNDIRSKVFMKGPIKGRIGGAVAGLGLGTGVENRAEYDFNSKTFVFQVGALLGQKGRAFSQEEQKAVESQMMKGFNSNDAAFHGSMRGVSRLVNSKAGYEMMKVGKDGKISINDGAKNSKATSSFKVGQTGTAKDGTPVSWDGKNWVG